MEAQKTPRPLLGKPLLGVVAALALMLGPLGGGVTTGIAGIGAVYVVLGVIWLLPLRRFLIWMETGRWG